MSTRSFKTYATHHGPIVREADGKWIAFALMNRPVAALEQSFLRTKATDYASFLKVAQLRANSSNNTLFADSKGEIAYLHPQFVPVRDDRFDYRKPVEGSNPATDWQGLHSLDSLPHVVSPANGWVMNTNNWPWTAAGADSPQAADFPRYMDEAGETPRGQHAVLVLNARRDFTPQTLIAAAYDPYLTAFARFAPLLLAAYDRLPADDPGKATLAEPIKLLRTWDYRWGLDSAPTSLAVFWGEALWAMASQPAKEADMSVWDYIAEHTTDAQKLAALGQASQRLTKDFGSPVVPWGEINRFQRNDAAIEQTFNDANPSIPVPFTSSQWGSLAIVRRKELSRHAPLLRHLREQLRRRDRVRPDRNGAGGHPPAERAATRRRSTSSTRRNVTLTATCAPSTSIPPTSRGTPSASINPESDSSPRPYHAGAISNRRIVPAPAGAAPKLDI